jgi:hypothetical protein
LEKYKLHPVAQGFTQQVGVDFLDTFSPTINIYHCQNRTFSCSSETLEFSSTKYQQCFLNYDLLEEVFMQLYKGYPNQERTLFAN